jgi:hypothetical protein
MKIGNLVSVKRKYDQKPVIGLVVEILKDDHNCVALVQPIKSDRNIYANPIDIEVLSESR